MASADWSCPERSRSARPCLIVALGLIDVEGIPPARPIAPLRSSIWPTAATSSTRPAARSPSKASSRPTRRPGPHESLGRRRGEQRRASLGRQCRRRPAPRSRRAADARGVPRRVSSDPTSTRRRPGAAQPDGHHRRRPARSGRSAHHPGARGAARRRRRRRRLRLARLQAMHSGLFGGIHESAGESAPCEQCQGDPVHPRHADPRLVQRGVRRARARRARQR